MSSSNNNEEQLVRDLQYALNLQAKEEYDEDKRRRRASRYQREMEREAIAAATESSKFTDDFQYALNLQAKEEYEEDKRRKRSNRHHREIERDGFANAESLNRADHMLYVLCEVDERRRAITN